MKKIILAEKNENGLFSVTYLKYTNLDNALEPHILFIISKVLSVRLIKKVG